MVYWISALISLLLACSVSGSEQRKPIVLGTNVIASESLSFSPSISGSIQHVECILGGMDYPYEIRTAPWRRARQDVKSGGLDGFFTAVSIDSANDFAHFSYPLVLESWYWYSMAGSVQLADWREAKQIGLILGSQQEAILNAEGYDRTVTANNLEQLIKLLTTKRVDAILVDKRQFENQIKALGINLDKYQSRFFRYIPLGVYFSHRFLDTHPQFMQEFNNRILECSDSGYRLTTDESNRIRKALKPLASLIAKSPEIQRALSFQKVLSSKTKPELDQIDVAWQEASKNGNAKFMDKYLLKSANQYLHELVSKEQSILSEIIVVNTKGYNIAVDPMTSDFWQGDEDKFLKAINLKEGSFFEDLIVYDASSHTFAVQFSTPFWTDDGRLQGVITFGVDVDKALSQSD